MIYADGPLKADVDLPGGGTWKNLVTEAKSKVAETLEEYRGNYRYNLMDEPMMPTWRKPGSPPPTSSAHR